MTLFSKFNAVINWLIEVEQTLFIKLPSNYVIVTLIIPSNL